jgi:hypothetical protein
MRLILFFLFMTFTSGSALAAPPLIFRDHVKGPREQEALNMLEKTAGFLPDLPYSVAATDLNGDGVDEWIFRQDREPGCEASANCIFRVLGLREGQPVSLGTIFARKISLSDEKSYGVRKIFAYNDKNNDFEYSRYVWDPTTGIYLLQ